MTIRRDLRVKFEEILNVTFNTASVNDTVRDLICTALADSAIEIFEKKPAFDFSKAGIEWAILAGNDIDQEVQDAAVLEKNTIDAFESAFSIKGNWNWYPAKPQEMRVWAIFRANLVQLYRVDKDCFTKYFTWAHQPFSRGAMTGIQIKNNPQNFMDSWASFCMSTKYAPPRKIVPDSERTDLDENGIPQSYM